jgi:hypothetical protein
MEVPPIGRGQPSGASPGRSTGQTAGLPRFSAPYDAPVPKEMRGAPAAGGTPMADRLERLGDAGPPASAAARRRDGAREMEGATSPPTRMGGPTGSRIGRTGSR